MKFVLSVKESNVNEKNQIFENFLIVRAEVADRPPPLVSLTVIYPLFLRPAY